MKVSPLAVANVLDTAERHIVMACVSEVDGITEYRLHNGQGQRLRRVEAFEDPTTGKLYRRLGNKPPVTRE